MIHLDYFEFENKNFIILVDRLTGYIACEKTQNKGTEGVILAVKSWANSFGYPYKVISDTGPAFRTEFIRQLLTLDVRHKPSSATTLRATALQRGLYNH